MTFNDSDLVIFWLMEGVLHSPYNANLVCVYIYIYIYIIYIIYIYILYTLYIYIYIHYKGKREHPPSVKKWPNHCVYMCIYIYIYIYIYIHILYIYTHKWWATYLPICQFIKKSHSQTTPSLEHRQPELWSCALVYQHPSKILPPPLTKPPSLLNLQTAHVPQF